MDDVSERIMTTSTIRQGDDRGRKTTFAAIGCQDELFEIFDINLHLSEL